MNAIISGQAGRALVGEGEQWSLLETGRERLIEWSGRDLRQVFHEADDLEFVRDITLDEARRMLDTASDRTEALQLALNLLDPDLSDKTRSLVAEDLDELLGKDTETAVRSVLFARPLITAVHDLDGARRLSTPTRVRALYDDLERAQPVVREVFEAWETLPDSLFPKGVERNEIRAKLVRAGWFWRVVQARLTTAPTASAPTIEQMLREPSLAELPDVREVVTTWARRLGPSLPPIVDMRMDAHPVVTPRAVHPRTKATVIGFEGSPPKGAFGVLPAIVDLGDGRVRIERDVPIELAREALRVRTEGPPITLLVEPFAAPDETPVVVYVDWDAACADPMLFRLYFSRFMTEASERIDPLLPTEHKATGRNFRLLVRDRAGATDWALRLFVYVRTRFRERQPPPAATIGSLFRWLKFVVPYTGATHRQDFAAWLYPWLLALAQTNPTRGVRPETVQSEIDRLFDSTTRATVLRNAETIRRRYFASSPASPSNWATALG